MRTLRALVSAAVVLIPAMVAAQSKPTVAVMPFSYVSLVRGGDTGALGEAVADMVSTELGGKQQIRLVERQAVKDLLDKQKLLVSGRVSDEDALRAGKLLNADYVIFGSVTVVRDEVRLDMRIVDVETGTYPKAPFKERGKQDDLLTLVEKL